jgi:hypothetical protein
VTACRPHLCSISSDDSERLTAAAAFVRLGLEQHQKCIYLVPDDSEEQTYRALKAGGIDVTAALAAEALQVTTPWRLSLKRDGFDPYRLFTFWKQSRDDAQRRGFAGVRGVGHLHDLIRRESHAAGWLEYEDKLSDIAAEGASAFLCQFDRRVSSASVMRAAARAHSAIIFGSWLCDESLETFDYGDLPPGPVAPEVARLLGALRGFERGAPKAGSTAAEVRTPPWNEFVRFSQRVRFAELSSALVGEIQASVQDVIERTDHGLRLLSAQAIDREHMRAHLNSAGQSMRRMAFELARIRSLGQRPAPAPQAFVLSDAIEAVCALAATELRRHEIRLDLDLVAPSPVVWADRLQIEHVVLTLIENAIESIAAAPAGNRRIGVRTHLEPAAHIVTTIEDSGPGISAEDARRLFEPFYTTKPFHMGLGLAIARSICHAHNGELWFESGARFAWSLPVSADR